ncbi:MAG: RNA polymerase subunit sigma-24 [Rhodospirillaceae bacterium]|nr:RNA polymerase subunit sigma-24 [Rhodospirillaceae bacterium]|tara:strand:- start:1183 stop:1722 length:540 start_codon:yes stop_codon:yes gene_type:complete
MANAEEPELDLLLAGNKAAWDRFVETTGPVVLGAIRRALSKYENTSDEADVFQDVFLRLCKEDFRLLRQYDSQRAGLKTWLKVVAHSAAIDALRRQRPPTVPLENVPEAALGEDKEPVERIKIPDDLLTPRQRLVITLLYEQDLEVFDVAERLEIDPQTVRSTHHKAMTRLREHFDDSH